MTIRTISWTATTLLATIVLLAMDSSISQAHEHAGTPQPILRNSPLQVTGALPPLDAGIEDLKFNEMFKMPVGPRGMEPSAKLLSLDKQRVRIIGYMANQENTVPGLFIVAPLPVHMGDDDDSFADDMPANSIFVHLSSGVVHQGEHAKHSDAHHTANVLANSPATSQRGSAENVAAYVPGLISLTGTLSVGNHEEADGRISFVRLLLDPAQSAQLSVPAPTLSAKK